MPRTIEKLQFSLPAVFTIGPEDRPESLVKYAKILTGQGATSQGTSRVPTSSGRSHVQDIVKGIIEGETRVIVSGMTMEEIFKERQVFKNHVIENVQTELNQFGLKIYNANVKVSIQPVLDFCELYQSSDAMPRNCKIPQAPSTSSFSAARPMRVLQIKPRLMSRTLA